MTCPPPPPEPAAWVDAGPVTDFEPGAGRRLTAGDVALAVFRGPGDRFHALADRCPHAGAPLSTGALRDGVVVCAWHGWRFDPETGRCANVGWGAPVPLHAVRVEDGRVLVSLVPLPGA